MAPFVNHTIAHYGEKRRGREREREREEGKERGRKMREGRVERGGQR